MFPYYPDVRGYREHHDDRGGTLMPNDKAALVYARRIIRELKEAGGYNDPALTKSCARRRRHGLFGSVSAALRL